MKYIEIKFQNTSAEQNEILIALLADDGFEGFEENESELKACIKETNFDKEAFEEIAKNQNIEYTSRIIEQQNWNAEWEKSFEPVIVDGFVAVRAGFHEPVTNVPHEIIVTPKMSFGTGHHPTTYLMMQKMKGLNFQGKSVLDFGTGTGVLAILAHKLGATAIEAIDNDEWSIDNAKENIQANGAGEINVYLADALSENKKYDIILANINLNVLTQHMPHIALITNKKAQILLSGFLEQDLEVIKNSLTKNGFIFHSFSQQKGWLCVEAGK